MKKKKSQKKNIGLLHISLFVLAISLGITGYIQSRVTAADSSSCTTIKSGTIVDSAGNPIVTGYDQFGYNYQAHMFNGTYDSVDRKLDGTYYGGTGDYVDDKLSMKWNDAWIANVDCNGDHKLDRGLIDGQSDGISKGWLTNHIVGDYTDVNGKTVGYTDFVKIVWTGAGSPLWGQYTLIQEVYNDRSTNIHGLYSTVGIPGLGLNDQWTTKL